MPNIRPNHGLAICALLAASLNADASVDAAIAAFGSDAIYYDVNQGFYWLTPRVTVGQTYLQASELLANDTRFSGFRFATTDELISLFASFGIPDINDYGLSGIGTTANVPGVTTLQSFFGTTYTIQINGTTLAETAGFVGASFISPINGFESAYLGDATLRVNVLTGSGPTSFAYAATNQSSGLVGTNYEGVGSWLVSAIPEPASWEMFASGVLLLSFLSIMSSSHSKHRK